MNWRIRMSLRLFGTPHRKKSAVTRTKGSMRPTGTSGCFSSVNKPFPELIGVIFTLSPPHRSWQVLRGEPRAKIRARESCHEHPLASLPFPVPYTRAILSNRALAWLWYSPRGRCCSESHRFCGASKRVSAYEAHLHRRLSSIEIRQTPRHDAGADDRRRRCWRLRRNRRHAAATRLRLNRGSLQFFTASTRPVGGPAGGSSRHGCQAARSCRKCLRLRRAGGALRHLQAAGRPGRDAIAGGNQKEAKKGGPRRGKGCGESSRKFPTPP